MKIIKWNFRLNMTETSFGSFGYQLVEIEENDMNKTEKQQLGLIPKEIAKSKTRTRWSVCCENKY